MLDYQEKGFGVYLVFMFIFLILNTILFCLMISSIAYSLKIERYKERDFNIYLPGLKSFNFISSSSKLREYTPSIPNLGYAGPLILDCYEGICREYNDHRNYDYDDDDYDYDPDDYTFFTQYNFFSSNIKNFLNSNLSEIKSFRSKPGDNDPDGYRDYAIYECSKDCALEGKCQSCPSEASSKYGKCYHIKNDFYNKTKYCYASNIIYRWNGLLFTRENMTDFKTYSYATNAFSKNEICPGNYKMCGFLDDDKNKLCLPDKAECPANHIEFGNSPPSDGHNYKTAILGNLQIYYTNEYENEGTIIEGLFVDSDYKEVYVKGCQTIAKGNLDDLMKDNYENIYIKENVNRNGNAYLKWCSPGHDRNINLTQMRKNYKEYTNNVTINKYIVDIYDASSVDKGFIGGFILMSALFIFVIGNLIGKYSQMRNSNCCICFLLKCNNIYSYSIFFFIFWFGSLMTNVEFIRYGNELDKIEKNMTNLNIDYDDVDIPNLIRINKALFSLYFIFLAFIIAFFITYCCIKSH